MINSQKRPSKTTLSMRNDRELSSWLLLLKAPQLGLQTFYQALAYFESAQAIIEANPHIRQQSKLFKKQTLDWLKQASSKDISTDLKWQEGEDCHIITLTEDTYPAQLKAIADPPPVLYVRGDLSLLSTAQIAVIGSRNPSPSGMQCTKDLTKQLVKSGLTITSGLAIGIDGQAHLSALENGGKTIAVCATGLDRTYPARHQNLARQISHSGALVSEFMIGTPPIANHFPKRNRIISGLSLGVLVVEARLKSGSLITARLAAEQGREVFSVPSSIYNNKARGCHTLIKQGAALVDCLDDVLKQINFIPKNQAQKAVLTENIEKKQPQAHNILLKYLSHKPTTVDELILKSKLNTAQVNQLLLSLELAGKIHHIPNSGFIRQ